MWKDGKWPVLRAEPLDRMRALRSQVGKLNVYRCAGQMRVDASGDRDSIRRLERRALEAETRLGGGS